MLSRKLAAVLVVASLAAIGLAACHASSSIQSLEPKKEDKRDEKKGWF